ncbi:hypothetical protein [Winogradskyella marincola]|uniref:Uncharacterized protein n=1 Tax=Winogradskyella marincola TaxID=3037795 RepID=A0ABT6FZ18_9FLAO|nr:hypothetical protein [Winogradskyella sp. YYF002]MDG4715031.1 hypothetical protein [Winogradskyella sp. YYF002]
MQRIKIVYIIMHSIILFGAGHGVGFLILTDIIFISDFLEGSFKFNYSFLTNEYLSAIGFFSLLGKVLIGLSMLRLKLFVKNILSVIGTLLLIYSVYILSSHNAYVGMLNISSLMIIVFYVFSAGMVLKELSLTDYLFNKLK